MRNLILTLATCLVVLVLAACTGQLPPAFLTPSPDLTATSVVAVGVTPTRTVRPVPPTMTPGGQATVTPFPTPPADPWNNIQASGEMAMGLSADYPPFAYYGPDGQLIGLDVDLVRALGEVLGVEVFIRDMDFDALGPALQNGHIDLAAGGITITPGRALYASFSDPYLVSSAAAIAAPSADLPAIQVAEDLAQFLIGTQYGSVFQAWLEDDLIALGIIPAENVTFYGSMDRAIEDLADGRLDLVVLDLPAAAAFVEAGKAKLVGQGLEEQRYALALPREATELQAQINGALRTLGESGQMKTLMEEYLGYGE